MNLYSVENRQQQLPHVALLEFCIQVRNRVLNILKLTGQLSMQLLVSPNLMFF